MANNININGFLAIKRGVYQIVLNWTIRGERKRKWISTGLPEKGNKRKAEALLKEKIEEYAQKLSLNPCDLLFGDYLIEWLDIIKPNLQTSTYAGYRNDIYNRIAPYFNKLKIKLEDITSHDIQKFYSYKMNHDNLSANSIRHFHANIRKALEYAVRNQIISFNPSKNVDLPRIEKKNIDYYSAEDLQILLNVIANTPLEIPVVITAYYGLRRSEIVALKWNDIDFENKSISVHSKIVQISGTQGKSIIEDTEKMKNASSKRMLPLISQVELYLRKLQENQRKDELFYGNAYDQAFKGYICRHPDGKLITPRYITESFPRIVQQNGLKRITFHGLRHSCATTFLKLGASIKEVQAWLGHSTYSTTADIYSHIEYEDKVSMSKKIDSVLSVC